MEAILSATALGGEIMLRPDPLGKVQPGYLADLILVDGSPVDDTTILQDHGKLNYIMKDGRFHSEPGDDDARHRTSTNSCPPAPTPSSSSAPDRHPRSAARHTTGHEDWHRA